MKANVVQSLDYVVCQTASMHEVYDDSVYFSFWQTYSLVCLFKAKKIGLQPNKQLIGIYF